jgi:predicted RNA-binding Zn-ribbon protein involved in translation (DUF1610 family)
MPIEFQCGRCGKKLRAPDSAVGQSSPCPACGAMVNCPEPVYEAEVVLVSPGKSAAKKPAAKQPASRQPPRINPYADLDDDKPYAMVDPPPAAETADESRRPCPVCGEFILTAAAKCRFCGEIFDAVLKRGDTKKVKKTRSRSAALDDGTGVRDLMLGFVSFALGLGLTLVSFANPVGGENGNGRFMVFYGMILGGILGMLRGIWAISQSGR